MQELCLAAAHIACHGVQDGGLACGLRQQMADVFAAAVYGHMIPKQDMSDMLELHVQPQGSAYAQPAGASFAQLVASVWMDGHSPGEQRALSHLQQ